MSRTREKVKWATWSQRAVDFFLGLHIKAVESISENVLLWRVDPQDCLRLHIGLTYGREPFPPLRVKLSFSKIIKGTSLKLDYHYWITIVLGKGG